MMAVLDLLDIDESEGLRTSQSISQSVKLELQGVTLMNILYFTLPLYLFGSQKSWTKYKYIQKCINTKLKTCYIKLVVTKCVWQKRVLIANCFVLNNLFVMKCLIILSLIMDSKVYIKHT